MSLRSSKPLRQRLLPWLGRQVLVVDQGSRVCKFLVAESFLGRVRLVHRGALDLPAEPLVARDEVVQTVEGLLAEFGPHAVAVALPQHRAIAQVIELPAGSAAPSRKLAEAEAVKLSGLSEGSLVFEGARLRPFGPYQNPYWLVLSQADDVADQVHAFSVHLADDEAEPFARGVCELTTTAQALFAAWQAVKPKALDAALVELGAHNTVVAVQAGGQGVFATNFPTGSADFTEAIARLKGCSLAEAEQWKCEHDLLTGPEALPGLQKVVDQWYGELRRSLAEWLEEHAETGLTLGLLPIFLSGGGALEPGLIEFANQRGSLKFQPWPEAVDRGPGGTMQPYWTAFGVALHALGKVARPISLLPPEARAERARALAWQKVQAANLGLILLVFLALGLGTWRHWQSIQQKEQLISETQTALLTAKTLSLLSQRLDAEYELIRPVLQRQRQTVETLRTLAAVQEVRTNNDFWYLLFADPVSYFAGATLPGAALSPTNLATSLFSTNLAPGWREFVAELCIPADGDAQRRTLSSVVTNLKLSPLFARVDELPAERKRSVVDPKVTISNKVFGIAIEVAPTLASPAAREPRAAAPRPAAPPPKSSVAGPARTNRPASAPAPASRPATNLPPARR